MSKSQTTVCRHDYLRFGSGGYYIVCVCGQTWTAKQRGRSRDDDFDRTGGSHTPLAGQDGALVWRDGRDA